MTVQQDEEAAAEMGRAQWTALRSLQAALLAYAAYALFRIYRTEEGMTAFAWAIPWLVLVAIVLLLLPALVRLGWRRFRRPAPAWAIAAIVCTTSWAVVTMLFWMALGIVLILSD